MKLSRRRLVAPGIVIALLMALSPRAQALDPSLQITQYAHASWKTGAGFSDGLIRAIAQTPDGYLWLGTEFGLRRFDGVRVVEWVPPAGQRLPNTDIRSLLGARDGRLWIGTFRGLASWKDGTLTHYPELDTQVVESLLEARDGTIWVAGWAASVGRLCNIANGQAECYGQDGRFGSGVTPIYQDRAGHLWVGAMNGVWRWEPGPPTLYRMPDPTQRIYALVESDDGGLLIAAHTGITKLKNGQFEAYPLAPGFQPHRLLRDRDGGLWIGALVDKGLMHQHGGRTDLFAPSDGLSDGSVNAILEDREGNIWVATDDGLDRFRNFAVPTTSIQQGLSSRGVSSILMARDGALWVGASTGLNRLMNREVRVYDKGSGLPDKAHALFQDASGRLWVGTQSGIVFLKSDRFVPVASVPRGIVYSFTDDSAGNLWVSHQLGLLHLRGARVAELIPWARLGRTEPAWALLHDPRGGGVWLGFLDGGVSYFDDHQLRGSFASGDGLGLGMVRDFYLDANGILWTSTEGGLSRVENGRIVTLTSKNGLPCDSVHWMREDDAHTAWLYLACGLLRTDRSELDSWASDPSYRIKGTVFDSADGVGSHRFTSGYNSVVTKSPDGKLLFVRDAGVSVIDPQHLAFNTLPPPVDIERVTADDKIYDAIDGLQLPPLVRDLQIDYTALSLVAPEKNRFRVMLEGRDKEWQEVGIRRQAFYTDLGPGSYRFKVIGSNNSGVWNQTGATLEFSIRAAYYQTRTFRAVVVVLALFVLTGGYLLRVRQVTRHYQQRLDERVHERMRIARELHDTLLQSFHGLLLRFQTAVYLLPDRPAEAKEHLESTVAAAAKAITEGRDAVQGLRASATERNDLAMAIRAFADELTKAFPPPHPSFRVAVEGQPREVHPIVRDEIYKIAAEAIRNAFRHAQAAHVEVDIRYDARQFQLRVRDDGVGIDPEVLGRQGLEGHYGLRGLPERAALVGGKLTVWSERGEGTELELRLPSRAAYRSLRGKTALLRMWVTRCLLLAAAILAPSDVHGQQLSQYAHTAWRFQEGVFDASPISIAQTADGYIWIGTLNGLIRFDGVRFESWNDRLHELNANSALALLGSSDGSLWIGTSVGLLKLKDGKLSAVTTGDGRYNGMIEDFNGRIWGARTRIRDGKGPLCEVDGTKVQCYGEREGLGCEFGNALAQDTSGAMWVADVGKVCSWNNGKAATYSSSGVDTACKPAIGWLLADVDQSMLVSCEGGLRRLQHGRFEPFQSASLDADRLRGTRLRYDRAGALWIGTVNDGLYRVADGVADHFSSADGLSDDKVYQLFEDREGNVWVVTPEGIDRFHRVSVVSFSSRQGLRGIGGSAVLASRDGRTIWASGLQGLASIREGTITVITPKEGLPGQQVTALFESHDGVLWMGIDQNLFSYANGRFIKTVRSDGKPTGMIVGMAEDANQSIWIVTAVADRLLRLDPKTGAAVVVPEPKEPSRITRSTNGVVYLYSAPLRRISILRDGRTWEHVALPPGPRRGGSLLAYGEDSLWVATDAGLYRWKDRQWSSLAAINGLPCEAVQDLVDDAEGGLWLHLACGFVHVTKPAVDAWSRDPRVQLNLKLYDPRDGARAGRGSFEPGHGRTANGHIWFANGEVLQMIDPGNVEQNDLPPPVHIERITADDKVYDATNGLRLPPRIRNVSIDYTALSLVAPEKVRFRYLLEGQDSDWNEVINDRQVQYSNLPPGSYRFRVIASNNSGVWNEAGAALEFAIAPAFYQTRWFQAAMMFAIAALLWLAYRMRVAQLAGQFNRTLEARVAERTRIARELHDTLLQSFHAVLLRLQAASYLASMRPAEAKAAMDEAISHAAKAITEGRDAVQGLRTSTSERNDLARAIRILGDELAGGVDEAQRPRLDVTVAGRSRDLHAILRDDVYKIAAEALRNAYRHAHAKRITVEIVYDDQQFRLRVRDNGSGIDRDVVSGQGVDGHYGMRGMHERASVMGGKLAIWSEIGAGVEVDLRLPAKVIYADGARQPWWTRWWTVQTPVTERPEANE